MSTEAPATMNYEELHDAYCRAVQDRNCLQGELEAITRQRDTFKREMDGTRRRLDEASARFERMRHQVVLVLAQVEGAAEAYFCPVRQEPGPVFEPVAMELIGDMAALAADAMRVLEVDPSHSPDFWTGYGRGRANTRLVDGGESRAHRPSRVRVQAPDQEGMGRLG